MAPLTDTTWTPLSRRQRSSRISGDTHRPQVGRLATFEGAAQETAVVHTLPPRRRRAKGVRVLCISQGRILLVLHEDRSTGRRWWVLPGGGREKGESLEEAAIRETREETGIDVQIVRRLRVPRDAPHVSYVLFLAVAHDHVDPSPRVDLSREEYLRAAAWHALTTSEPLGPLDPAFWGYLAQRIVRLLSTPVGGGSPPNA